MMGEVIIFNDESIDFIWNTIQNQQIIFHPEIAPEGKIKYDIFAATKYSLQGTTQGNGLTGGVPPVRFSM